MTNYPPPHRNNSPYQTAILALLALLYTPLDGVSAMGLAFLANGGLVDDYTMRNGEVVWSWERLLEKTVELWPG